MVVHYYDRIVAGQKVPLSQKDPRKDRPKYKGHRGDKGRSGRRPQYRRR